MAKMTKFQASYGTSAEIKGIWHKFGCTIEIEMDPGDNSDEVKERAWETVFTEVEKQIRQITGA